MHWQQINSGFRQAQEHMDKDAQILASLEHPLIHHYDWEGPSATIGHFIDPYQWLNKETVQQNPLQIARRPTGGGIIFHLSDLAFSLFIPAHHSAYSVNTMDNYAFVNQIVCRAIRYFLGKGEPQLLEKEPEPLDVGCRNFCMAKPTRYDVIMDGKKVGGAAQRRTKRGFLHQGSISLAPTPMEQVASWLLPGTKIQEAMQQNSYFLVNEVVDEKRLFSLREQLRSCLNAALCSKHSA